MIKPSIVIWWTWRLYQFRCMHDGPFIEAYCCLPFPWKQWFRTTSCGDVSMFFFFPLSSFSVASQGHIRRMGKIKDKKANLRKAGSLCHDLFNRGSFQVKGNTSSQCALPLWVVSALDSHSFIAPPPWWTAVCRWAMMINAYVSRACEYTFSWVHMCVQQHVAMLSSNSSNFQRWRYIDAWWPDNIKNIYCMIRSHDLMYYTASQTVNYRLRPTCRLRWTG